MHISDMKLWGFPGALVVKNPPAYVGGASLVTQMLKRLPAMWETRVRSLSQEDPLEKEIATHSSTLA